MLRRLGGVFVLLLGSVIIASGVSDSGGATVGALPCAPQALIGVQNPCPTGTITFTEESLPATDPATPPPASWTVTVTSLTCSFPDGGAPQQVVVPNNSSAVSPALYVYAFRDDTTVQCEYGYTVAAVTGYTTVFTPTGPISLPTGRDNPTAAVKLTATTGSAPTTSVPPVTSSAPVTDTPTTEAPSSEPASSSAASVTRVASSSAGLLPTQASRTDAAPIANTGTDHIGGTLALGIGLVLLGLVLIFETRLRRLFARGGRHSA